MLNYKVTIEPENLPVSLSEVKSHLRVCTPAEDAQIERYYIPAATRVIEQDLNRKLITQTMELILDDFPDSDQILLPGGSIQSIVGITYYDEDGVEQTLSTADYIQGLDFEPARIIKAPDATWPTVRSTYGPKPVVVTYVAGYGDNPADVPATIRQAILLTVAHYYYNREAVVTGTIATELPQGVKYLIEAERVGDDFSDYEGGLL